MLLQTRVSMICTPWIAAVLAMLLLAAPSSGEMRATLEGVAKLKVKACGGDVTPLSLTVDMADGGTWSARDHEGDTYTGTWVSVGAKKKYELRMDSPSLAFLKDELESDATDLCHTPVSANSSQLRKFELKANRRGDQAKLKMKYQFTGSSFYGTGKASYQVSLKGDLVERAPNPEPGGHPDPSSYLLTIQKAGIGGGTVTGPAGIYCGTACEAIFDEGEYVTLTASAAGGSSFVGWSGCDSVDSNQCTVSMDDDRVVSASFGFATGGVEITALPETDTDGTYTLQWNCTGFLCSTSFVIEEDDHLGFTSPATYSCNAATQGVNGCQLSPRPSFTFTGKADGTWCYRVAMSGSPGRSEPACVAVTRPTGGVLRLVNASSYDMIDIRLNGHQHAGYLEAIPVGQYFDFSFTSSGWVEYELGVGFWNRHTRSRDVWYTLTGRVYVAPGSVQTVTFSNPTIGQLLTGFRASADWYGPYWIGTSPYYKRFHFESDGSWTLYDSTSPCMHWSFCSWTRIDSGVAQLVSWPHYSPIVTFQLKPGTPAIQLPVGLGGATMKVRNGPPFWPIIEYTIH